jgi:hypothetical protein
MPPRSCRVTIRDTEGLEHTAQVTASTLYEAIALALVSLRGKEWVAGIPEGLNPVKVCVTDIPVERTVTMKDFTRWLIREEGSPKDRISRSRVKEILGMLRPSDSSR